MAYIGQGPGSSGITDRTLDTVTSDGSTTSLVLTGTADAAEDVAVYFDGVMQRPGTDFTLANNTLTFTSPVPNGVFVVAYTGGAEHIGSPLAGSVTSDMIVDNAVIDAKVATGVDASKITGALGAFDGSALTGISSSNITKTSSDPTITDNPSSAGGLHLNTTTGEMFVCTDNTTNKNVWVNVGGGFGDTFTFQGRIAGYTVGGATVDNIPANGLNSIEKYAFASSGMSVADHGDASVVKGMSAGHTGALHGYVTGGGPAAPGVSTNVIERYAYSSNAGTDDVGDLIRAENQHAGVSGTTDGYVVAGYSQSTAITKFSFESSSNSVNIGNVTIQRYSTAGINSSTDGYVTGGYKSVAPTGVQTSTEKFSFSSGSNSAHGSMTNIGSGFDGNGISSTTHGYAIGGYIIPSVNGLPRTGHIDKFSFSSSANGTSIGEISDVTNTGGHWSSTTHGYYYGGRHTSFYTAIRRFDYSTETIQNSVGTLSSGRVYPSSANQ